MTPRNEFGPHRREGDERKRWRAFWDEMPHWVRTVIVVAMSGALGATGREIAKSNPAQQVFWNEDDLRKIFKEELAPLKAGFTAFVRTRPDREQVVILRAMAEKAEEIRKGR